MTLRPDLLAALLAAALLLPGCGPDGAATRPEPSPAPTTLGAAEARTLFSPSAFADGALEVAVAPGERVALFLLNVGGRDGAAARLAAEGLEAPALASASLPVVAGAPRLPPGDAAVLARSAALEPPSGGLAPAPAARPGALETALPAARRAFCVLADDGFTRSERRATTLAREGSRVLLYVDDRHAAELEPQDLDALAAALADRILPAVADRLGAPADSDGNGRLTVVVTPLPRVWGYFWAQDLVAAADATADCSGGGSNAGDLLYVAPPSAMVALGWTREQALRELLPGVLAHELAHLRSFQRRCVERRCARWEETWVEEGIAKVVEDEAGYGWAVSRWTAQLYLARTRDPVWRGYDGRSLTLWEGDGVGNYEGAHAFFRFFTDREGPALLARLTADATGLANVERALGRSFEEALADFATALMFSNEPAAGFGLDFTGAAWTPLHARLRPLDAVPLGPAGALASLRVNGWNAFVTGAAGPAGGRVRVQSSEAAKPWVAVVRFRGELDFEPAP